MLSSNPPSPSASPVHSETKFEYNLEDDKKPTTLPEVMFSQQDQPFYVLQHTPDVKHVKPVFIGPVPEIKHINRDEDENDDDLFGSHTSVRSVTDPKDLKEKEVRQSWVDLMAGTEDEQKLKAKVAAQKAAFGNHLCSLLESELKNWEEETSTSSTTTSTLPQTNHLSFKDDVLKKYQDTFTHYYDWARSRSDYSLTRNLTRNRPPAGLSMDQAELAYWAYLDAAAQQINQKADDVHKQLKDAFDEDGLNRAIRESAAQAEQGVQAVKRAPTLATLVSKKPAQLPTIYQDIEQRIAASSEEVTQYNEQQAAIAKKAEKKPKASAPSSSGRTDSLIDEKQKALKVEPKKLAIGQGMGIQDVLTHFFKEDKEVQAEQKIVEQGKPEQASPDDKKAAEAAKERIKQARRAFEIYLHSLPERELQTLFAAELKEATKPELSSSVPSSTDSASVLPSSEPDSSASVEQPKPETVIEINIKFYSRLNQHFSAAMRILEAANEAVKAQSQEIDLTEEKPAPSTSTTATKTPRQLLAERVREKLQDMDIIPAEAPGADGSTTEESSLFTTTQAPALDTLDDEEVIHTAEVFNAALQEVDFEDRFWNVYARLMQGEVPYKQGIGTEEDPLIAKIAHTVQYSKEHGFTIPTTVDEDEDEPVTKEGVAAFFSQGLFGMQNRTMIALAVKQYVKYLPDQKRHPLLKLASDHWRALVVILAMTGISVALLTFFNAPLIVLAALGPFSPLVFAALAFIALAIVWAVIKLSYNRWQGKERSIVAAIGKFLQRFVDLESRKQKIDIDVELNDEALAESLGKLPKIRWDGRRLPSKPAWVVAMLCASTAMVLILSGVEILGFIPGVTWTSLAVLSAVPAWQAAVLLAVIMLGAAVIGILLTEMIRWAVTSRMDDDKGTQPHHAKKEVTKSDATNSRKNSETAIDMPKLNADNNSAPTSSISLEPKTFLILRPLRKPNVDSNPSSLGTTSPVGSPSK